MENNEKGHEDYITPDKISLKWLFEHLSLSIWLLLISSFIAVFMFGATINNLDAAKRLYRAIVNYGNDERAERLEREKRALRIKIDKLVTECVTLKSDATKLTEENRRLIAKVRSNMQELNERSLLRKQILQGEQKITELQSKYGKQIELNSNKMREMSRHSVELKKKIADLYLKIAHMHFSETDGSKRSEQFSIGQEEARQLKESVIYMSSSKVAGFLKKIIPKIKGGISCHDLADLLTMGNTGDADSVVKQVAPYIQRPFPPGCFQKLSSAMYSGESADAIAVLINSKPMK